MKTCFIYLVVIATMLSTTMAAYDSAFCDSNMKGIDPNAEPDTSPSFYDNFFVMIEMKQMLQRNIFNIEEMYSQQAGRVFMSMDTALEPYQVWVDSWNDDVMVGPFAADDVCTENTFDDSDPSKLFGAVKDDDGKTVLNDPGVALHWDPKIQKKVAYKGENIVRGINVFEFWTCEYYEYVDATTFTQWYFIDSGKSKLPLQNGKVLPVSAKTVGQDKSNASNPFRFETRYDFTHFKTITPDDPGFQVPPNYICAGNGNKLPKPLPKVPDYFRFRGEQTSVMPPDQPGGDDVVQMNYVIEEYYHTLKLFVQDIIQTPNDNSMGNDKAYIRRIDDFNTGTSYYMDLNSGVCNQAVIDPGNDDSLSTSGGMVQIRDANQFFDLDYDKYQYMGVHTVRGIDCDTWSAKFDNNQPEPKTGALYTWYFANPDWMTENGYSQAFTMPVQLVSARDDNLLYFNFFEFTDDFDKDFPDVSLCYAQDSVINMEIFFSGRYDKYVSPDPFAFRHAFLASLLEFTALLSPLRIADMDIQPADNNEIVVRFKLLDKVIQAGDVSTPLESVSNKELMKQIVSKVNDGKYYINVGDTGAVQLKARQNSAGQTTRGSIFSSSDSSGFSAGSMAGIGVGMLVSGALLGVLIVFLVKKFRGGGSGGDIGMSKFANDSES